MSRGGRTIRLLKLLSRLSAAAILVWGAGCAVALQPEEYRLIQTSRYSELEKLMESRITQPSSAPTAQLFHLCYAYSKLKRYNKLFPCLDQLEKNIEKGDRNVFFYDFSATPSLMRAEAYIEFGDYTKAIEESTKAYDMVLKKDLYRQFRIFALTAMGLSHALNGDSGSAKKYAALLEEVGTHYPFNTLETDKVTGLAKVYMALGEFDKSLGAIKRDQGGALFRALTDVITGAALTGDTLWAFNQLPKAFILNKSLLETGQVQQAKEGYDQLLRRPETKYNGDIYWMILWDRGRIAEREGKPKEAMDFYKQAIDVVEEQRSTINTEANKIGYVGNKQSVYQRLIALLVSERQHASAFEYVERSKARALVDLLASRRDFSVPTGNPEQVRALLNTAQEAEAASRIQETSAPAAGFQGRSLAVRARQQLREQAPELASLVSVTHVPAADIQRRIPDDEVLIEYYYDNNNLYAFVLSNRNLTAVKLDGAHLEAGIRQLRESLEPPLGQEYLALSQRLYERLIRPLEQLLDKRHLLIVAHGALHYLPFNALHNGSEFLLDRYGIHMLPSASLMQYLKTAVKNKPGGVLAFGNPDLGDPRANLAHAQEEALAISKERPQSKVFLREKATKTAFKEFAAAFSYLHFATHGQFNPDFPLQSALLLAKDEANDGELTAGELYSLRLDAELVTLSACETGLGKISNGDDVVGLTRGFLYAGANSIVASLWKVDDRATYELMTKFYANLKTAAKGDALREAQLDIKKKYPHPFFWAAFQLTGMAR